MSQTGHALVVDESVGWAARIRLARIAAGLSPSDVAAAIEVSQRTYQRIEDGSRRPSRLELIAIAQLTGQDIAFFGASLQDPEAPNLPPLPAEVNPDKEA